MPKEDGDITTFNLRKCRIKDCFYLTGLTHDRKQLVVLLNDNIIIFSSTIQSTLQNCLSAREVWESLEAKFLLESILEAILHRLQEVKPRTSCSAKELRRLLEHLKTYVRHTKESGCSKDLDCCATVDVIEQKINRFPRA